MSPLVIGIIIAVVLIIGVIVFISINNKPSDKQTLPPQPSQQLNTVVNKVNCQVSDWSVPSDESCAIKSNGKYYKTKTRTVTTQPQNGGNVCPALSEDILCPAINCQVSDWSVPSDESCAIKSNGKYYKTKTRTVATQPQNGGNACPALSEDILCPAINCQVSDWTESKFCDSDGNRTRTRVVITQPKFGGTVCPDLSETNYDETCFTKETCGIINKNMEINNVMSLQEKIFSQDANKIFWEGYKCSINDEAKSNISQDKLCSFADNNLNNTNYLISEPARRAKVLLQCPGSLLQEGNFIGAGKVSGNFFTITVDNVVPASADRGLNLDKNVGKKIRIWYGNDGYPTGWAFSEDWVYPSLFTSNNVTLADLGSIDYTSALEIIDKRIGTSLGYKFILWFIDGVPRQISNSPKEAVKWISINKPSTIKMDFGSDAAGLYLGTMRFNGTLTYGSGDLNSPATPQHIRYNSLYRIMTSRLNLQP